LQPSLVRFDDAKEALLLNLRDRFREMRRRLDLARTGLEAGSPLAVMERGFSVVYAVGAGGKPGKLVRDASELKTGSRLLIRPLKGRIEAETLKIEP
jgi:exodeoxyribonuclease VII large subunit